MRLAFTSDCKFICGQPVPGNAGTKMLGVMPQHVAGVATEMCFSSILVGTVFDRTIGSFFVAVTEVSGNFAVDVVIFADR